jgi:hypothetical protein
MKTTPELQREWESIQWALDQGAFTTKEQERKAAARQLEIERELEKVTEE